jgi:hypothetical protein
VFQREDISSSELESAALSQANIRQEISHTIWQLLNIETGRPLASIADKSIIFH